MAVAGCVGAWVGRKCNKFVKCAGTSLIGSFFLFHGISHYAGGFPPLVLEIQENLTWKFYVYCAGMVVATIGGTYVQMKYIASDDVDEAKDGDDFT